MRVMSESFQLTANEKMSGRHTRNKQETIITLAYLVFESSHKVRSKFELTTYTVTSPSPYLQQTYEECEWIGFHDWLASERREEPSLSLSLTPPSPLDLVHPLV